MYLVCLNKIYSENPSHTGRVHSNIVIDVCLYFPIIFVTLLQTFILSLVVSCLTHVAIMHMLNIYIYIFSICISAPLFKSHRNEACPITIEIQSGQLGPNKKRKLSHRPILSNLIVKPNLISQTSPVIYSPVWSKVQMIRGIFNLQSSQRTLL